MPNLLLVVVLTLLRVGRPVSIDSTDPEDASSPASHADTSLDVGGPATDLEYSGIKHLKTEEELKDFTFQKRLYMIYFKPEVDMTPEQRNVERQFLDAAKNASEYLRWGFDVRVGRMDCVNVKIKDVRDKACDPKIVEANVARFYKGKREMLDLELTTLFDEDSILANVLTVSTADWHMMSCIKTVLSATEFIILFADCNATPLVFGHRAKF